MLTNDTKSLIASLEAGSAALDAVQDALPTIGDVKPKGRVFSARMLAISNLALRLSDEVALLRLALKHDSVDLLEQK